MRHKYWHPSFPYSSSVTLAKIRQLRAQNVSSFYNTEPLQNLSLWSQICFGQGTEIAFFIDNFIVLSLTHFCVVFGSHSCWKIHPWPSFSFVSEAVSVSFQNLPQCPWYHISQSSQRLWRTYSLTAFFFTDHPYCLTLQFVCLLQSDHKTQF